MDSFFAKILEINLLASVMIALILVLRAACKGMPHGLKAALWAVLGARLLLPFSFETEIKVLSAPKQPLPAAVQSVPADNGISPLHLAAVVWLCGAAAWVVLRWGREVGRPAGRGCRGRPPRPATWVSSWKVRSGAR